MAIDLDSAGPTSRIYFSQRLRLHYVDWGNPTAPPLLLLHGGRDHCRNWDWVASALRRGWHFLPPRPPRPRASPGGPPRPHSPPPPPYTLPPLSHPQGIGPPSLAPPLP